MTTAAEVKPPVPPMARPEMPAHPEQQELPFAVVQGQPLVTVPKDLYIPPDALEVILEAFEGPLDLLWYLIKRQNLDVVDIPIAQITEQYMGYIDMMRELRLELAADYLLMAAMLAEIKSRMLLPRPVDAEDEDGEDPRAELIRRLQEYERYKQAAQDIDDLPLVGRDVFPVAAACTIERPERPPPVPHLNDLTAAFAAVMRRAALYTAHQVEREPLSVRERMTRILDTLDNECFVEFSALFDPLEGRLGVVVTFMATLELIRESLLELVQTEAYGPIRVKRTA